MQNAWETGHNTAIERNETLDCHMLLEGRKEGRKGCICCCKDTLSIIIYTPGLLYLEQSFLVHKPMPTSAHPQLLIRGRPSTKIPTCKSGNQRSSVPTCKSGNQRSSVPNVVNGLEYYSESALQTYLFSHNTEGSATRGWYVLEAVRPHRKEGLLYENHLQP